MSLHRSSSAHITIRGCLQIMIPTLQITRSLSPPPMTAAQALPSCSRLARSLPKDTVPVWLVFFDAEDNGRIEGWDWILGSREFVKNNPIQPQAAVIVDMIGDADLNIYKERNSNPELTDEIWATAQRLGYEDKFIDAEKHSMLDDHTPFLEAGIPAVDIIDFDYPYWHTMQDTPDKVSAESLKAVGDTLLRLDHATKRATLIKL